MHRERDSKRNLVYDAERAAFKRYARFQTFSNAEDIEKYINRITATKYWGKLTPNNRRVIVNMRKMTAHAGFARSGGTHWPHYITLDRNRGGMSEWIVLHELAHCMVESSAVAAHGPEFCRLYLKLVDWKLGKTAGNILREEFKTRKIQYVVRKSRAVKVKAEIMKKAATPRKQPRCKLCGKETDYGDRQRVSGYGLFHNACWREVNKADSIVTRQHNRMVTMKNWDRETARIHFNNEVQLVIDEHFAWYKDNYTLHREASGYKVISMSMRGSGMVVLDKLTRSVLECKPDLGEKRAQWVAAAALLRKYDNEKASLKHFRKYHKEFFKIVKDFEDGDPLDLHLIKEVNISREKLNALQYHLAKHGLLNVEWIIGKEK